jgi:Family of unknown function (DUF6152)
MKPAIKKKTTGLTGVLILLFGAPVFGHHSFAPFDMNASITLTGVVKEFQWANPHVWIQVMVTDKSGTAVEWSIEGTSPAGLNRKGWKPGSLKAGDQVVIEGHPLRDGRRGASLVSAKLPDGTVLKN